MDLRTPLLVVSLLSCLGLGAWAMQLKGEVNALSEQVAELEAAREAAAKARSERRSERRRGGPRGGLQARSGGGTLAGGGPAGMGLLDGAGPRRRSSDSGGARDELLREAEENVRAEMASERKARFAERAEAMDAALQDYMAQAGYADEVAADINALFDANRADIDDLFARVEAGELDRSAVREQMRLIREDTDAALTELLGEEEAQSLEEAVFRGGRRPEGGPGASKE